MPSDLTDLAKPPMALSGLFFKSDRSFSFYPLNTVHPLDDQYYDRLNDLALAIQESPVLAQYLDEEEDDVYNQLRQEFEPQLSDLHHQVAAEAPLQLVTFEKYLLEPAFEGLYLPRVLGFAVLRGEITDQYKYVRPNDHFKDILLAICQSPHFDQLKKRIGQSISVGFALSSDIWITNMLSLVENKRIRNFLINQKNDRYRDLRDRADLYFRYSNQFKNERYYSADFPTQAGEMKANFSALRQFLLKRFETGGDNSSLKEKIRTFLATEEFHNTDEYIQMLAIYGNFMDLNEEERKEFSAHFERQRRSYPEFDLRFLRFINTLQEAPGLTATNDERMSNAVDKSWKDRISDYYAIADKIHSLGYVHPEAIEAVQEFYNTHEGLSIESGCLRKLILMYFTRLLQGLTEKEYADYFELNKIFNMYIRIFGNQEFNQEVEKISMEYVGKLLKKFTDKRSKDYQDVKKFVATQFVDVGFLKEKEVVEMFKTRRKRRKTAE